MKSANAHTVLQGGGHTGHDGKFAAGEKVVQQEKKVVEVVKKTKFAKRTFLTLDYFGLLAKCLLSAPSG